MNVHEHGEAALHIDVAQVGHDGVRGGRVEARHGLIGEHDARLLREGARDRDALLLAARERAGASPYLVEDADRVERTQGDLAVFRARQAEQRAVGGRVGEAADERVAVDVRALGQVEGLEDHADVAAGLAQLSAPQRGDLVRADGHATLGNGHEPVDRANERRFAGAREPDDRHHLARAYLERDIAQRAGAARVGDGDVVERDAPRGGTRREPSVRPGARIACVAVRSSVRSFVRSRLRCHQSISSRTDAARRRSG